MIKILIKNPERFIWLSNIPLIGRFFSFYIPCLKFIKEDKLYADVVARLRYGDVTGKSTEIGRFDDLIDVLDLLPDQDLLIHDVGCSSGVTSLDLMSALELKNKKYELTISDRFLVLLIFGKRIKYLYDSDEILRQIYLGRILCDEKLSNVFFLSRLLFQILTPRRLRDLEIDEVDKVALVNQEVREYIESGDLIAKSYNIFMRDDDNRYNFIRCMNLLNRSYFSDDQIVVGLKNLINALEHKGHLQIGRTDIYGVNMVSVFQKNTDGLALVLQFNGGAEIEHLVEIMNA